MESVTIYSSNFFKVKNPREFRKEFTEQIKGEESLLMPTKNGFKIWIKNLETGNRGLQTKVDFFQKYLRENETLSITCTKIDQKNNSCDICLHVLSPIAYKMIPLENCIKEMQKKLYPKYVISQVLVKHYSTKLWIEKGREYKALKEERTRLRHYLIIEHGDGRKVKWPKEYFQDVY